MAINTNILYKVTVYLNSAYGKNEGKKEDDRGMNIEVSGAEESRDGSYHGICTSAA